MFKQKIVAAGVALAVGLTVASGAAQAADKPLKAIGITVGSLGNPYFVTITKGAEAKAKQINPGVKVTAVSADYDMNKQFTQIDNFISAHVDLILLNAADPKAIEPAVKKARAAGIVVIAVDVAAAGADATVQTNNVQAGELSCDFIAKKLKGKGNVIIENGPPVSAVVDRVKGCKSVFAKEPGSLALGKHGLVERRLCSQLIQGFLTGLLGKCRALLKAGIGIGNHGGSSGEIMERRAPGRAPASVFSSPGSGGLEIDRGGLAALVLLELVRDALILIERAHAGALDGGNVHERIVTTALRRNEAIALVGIEEFYGSGDHFGYPLVPSMTGMGQQRHIPASVRQERDKGDRDRPNISVAGDVSASAYSPLSPE